MRPFVPEIVALAGGGATTRSVGIKAQMSAAAPGARATMRRGGLLRLKSIPRSVNPILPAAPTATGRARVGGGHIPGFVRRERDEVLRHRDRPPSVSGIGRAG